MNLWLIFGAAANIEEAEDACWWGFALYNNFWLLCDIEDEDYEDEDWWWWLIIGWGWIFLDDDSSD